MPLRRPPTIAAQILHSHRRCPTLRLRQAPCAHSFQTTPLLHRSRDPHSQRSRSPQTGLSTPVPDPEDSDSAQTEATPTADEGPFRFLTGYAAWPKRPPRPFPPPFFSPPSGSFSDPLSTHNRARDRINGEQILGVTNGDDALFAGERFLCVNDGVGAWGMKDRGCAGLWSRLVGHFWAKEVTESVVQGKGVVEALTRAFEKTKEALSEPNEWLGTTTVSSALLHHSSSPETPLLYVTQLGDCKVMVVRPSLPVEENIIFHTEEQYHYFDCPRQLGTNSPDTPETNAVLSTLPLELNDIVLALSDGVTDNLWEHEIARIALETLDREKGKQSDRSSGEAGSVRAMAQEIVLEARKIAEDVFAESPYMEKGVEEGLAIEGGKLDDISVVAGIVRRRERREKG